MTGDSRRERRRALLRDDPRAAETAGTFDLDAELKIWVSGASVPIEKTFTKGVDIYEVQAILTQFVAQ
jgi:hypothetical protein